MLDGSDDVIQVEDARHTRRPSDQEAFAQEVSRLITRAVSAAEKVFDAAGRQALERLVAEEVRAAVVEVNPAMEKALETLRGPIREAVKAELASRRGAAGLMLSALAGGPPATGPAAHRQAVRRALRMLHDRAAAEELNAVRWTGNRDR